jgi:hypothetical protein
VQNRQGPEASLNNNSYSYSTDVCFVECCWFACLFYYIFSL